MINSPDKYGDFMSMIVFGYDRKTMKPKRSYDEITEVIPEPVKVAVTPSFKHLNFVLVEEYFATGRPKVEIQKAKILRVEEPSDVEISKELSDLQNAVINNHY